jgi:peptidoglycan/xylan/chitin deacetylase (PgdA/CDA1 family)
VSVDLAGLRALRNGDWPHERPGLIISFDDGLRTHADVVAPLLEQYGLCGWFMVPVDFVDVPPAQQSEWARDHSIQFSPGSFADGRIALDWGDVRRLDASHVVACHTRSHQRLGAELDDRQLEFEIPGSKKILEERVGHEVPVFAWVGGEEPTYSDGAAGAIRAAGFEFSFMTNNAVIRPSTDPLQLQRSNIEADFPLPLTRFTLSGFYDLMYWPNRRRVNRLTATKSP